MRIVRVFPATANNAVGLELPQLDNKGSTVCGGHLFRKITT